MKERQESKETTRRRTSRRSRRVINIASSGGGGSWSEMMMTMWSRIVMIDTEDVHYNDNLKLFKNKGPVFGYILWSPYKIEFNYKFLLFTIISPLVQPLLFFLSFLIFFLFFLIFLLSFLICWDYYLCNHWKSFCGMFVEFWNCHCVLGFVT